VKVRPVQAQDELAISAIHGRCVGDVFAGLLGEHVPSAAERDERARSWAGPFGAPHPRHALFVAERDGAVVGFAAAGPTRDAGEDTAGLGEVRALMVDEHARGTGAGDALLEACEAALSESEFAVATLWVISKNARAVRFYERHGWRADGTEKPFEVDARVIDSMRLRKRLQP
jgi:GNAT superfamily N-acetyltransferase